MILAILIITIFNTGLILILAGAILMGIKEHITDTAKCINDNTDKDIETLGTAVFNMESIKTKVKTSGRFEA